MLQQQLKVASLKPLASLLSLDDLSSFANINVTQKSHYITSGVHIACDQILYSAREHSQRQM